MGIFDGIIDALTTDDSERAQIAKDKFDKAKAAADAAHAEYEAEKANLTPEQQQTKWEWVARTDALLVQAGDEANAAAAKAGLPAVFAPEAAPAEVTADAPVEQAPAVDQAPAVEEPAVEAPAVEAPAVEEAAPEAAGGAAEVAPKPKKEKKEEHRTYTVKRGDTLSEIGQKFGVNWREIAKINHVKNPDLIFPGQVFKIPND